MAVLTNNELTWLRRKVAAKFASQGWNKTEINAALQGVEDYFEATAKVGLKQAIQTAVPGVFNSDEKAVIVAYYVLQKAVREGVS